MATRPDEPLFAQQEVHLGLREPPDELKHAFFSWTNGQAHGPADLSEAAVELTVRYRGPYRPALD
jgi:hypothetical protein